MICKRCKIDKPKSEYKKKNSTICIECKGIPPSEDEFKHMVERVSYVVAKNKYLKSIIKQFVYAYIEKDKKKLYIAAELGRDVVFYTPQRRKKDFEDNIED